jgi:hypothetical protein
LVWNITALLATGNFVAVRNGSGGALLIVIGNLTTDLFTRNGFTTTLWGRGTTDALARDRAAVAAGRKTAADATVRCVTALFRA